MMLEMFESVILESLADLPSPRYKAAKSKSGTD
jgi:hypothetical protein